MVNKLLRLGVYVLFLCGAFFSEANAEGSTGHGTVYVTVSSGGQVLANASVGARSWTDAGYRVSGTTDENGVVVFSNMPVGTVDVYLVDDNNDITAKNVGELTTDNGAVNISLTVP